MDAIEVLRKLIQFNTVDGNHQSIKDCMQFICNLLTDKGYNPEIFSKNPDKPILYLRIKGKNSKALLLYGHIDVASTEGQEWKYPPFEAVIDDQYMYGRGAIDMKGPIVMMLFALINLKEQNVIPENDIIFILTSDEEVGGLEGFKYLVEDKAELFKDVLYGISEFGAVPLFIGDKKFYLIQVKTKQTGIFRATIKGTSTHTSLASFGETYQKLSKVLNKFRKLSFRPMYLPIVRRMFHDIAASQKLIFRIVLKLLFNPLFTRLILNIFDQQLFQFRPLFYNSVILTHIKCIAPVHFIPETIEIYVVYRLLPGVKPLQFLENLQKKFNNNFRIEQHSGEEINESIDFGLFDKLKEIILKYDKEAVPLPILLPASTDARWIEQLGIQSYGFTPVFADKEFDFVKNIHSVNEHIPVAVLGKGIDAYCDLLKGQ